MEPQAAFDQYAHGQETTSMFTRLTGVLIGVLVALLAIATIGSSRGATDALLAQGKAGDASNHLEAVQIRNYLNSNDSQILSILSAQHGNHQQALAVAQKFRRLVNTAATVTIARKVADDERVRDAAERKHHVLEYAEAAFQIGVLLASASIAIGIRLLTAGSILAGVVGLLLMIDGFFAVTSLHF